MKQFLLNNMDGLVFLAVTIIGFIYWLIRLEGKVKEHDKAICNLQEQQEKAIDKLDNKLDRVEEKIESLGKEISALAGYLKRCQEER